MDYRKEFERIMSTQKEMAIASSVGNVPNVRIVNFLHFKKEDGDVLYFGSFKGCKKVEEFAQNDQVSFTTVPRGDDSHFVRGFAAKIKTSDQAIESLKEAFIEKVPPYEEIFAMAGDQLVLFEVRAKEVELNLDNMETSTLKL